MANHVGKDEAADLPRLHHLRFYEVQLKEVEKLESLDQLASIRIQRTQFENEALFHQLEQQHGIQLENLDLHEEMIIEIP